MSNKTTCPYDTNGDGDCHLCARNPKGCFKPTEGGSPTACGKCGGVVLEFAGDSDNPPGARYWQCAHSCNPPFEISGTREPTITRSQAIEVMREEYQSIRHATEHDGNKMIYEEVFNDIVLELSQLFSDCEIANADFCDECQEEPTS